MHINKKLSALFVFALLVGIGYIGAQYFNVELFADRQSRNDNYMKVPDHSAIEAQERAKPRFSGEIGGIFLAPDNTQVPEKFTTFQDVCDGQLSHYVPNEEAGILALDVELPEEYRLDTENENSGTTACGDIVYRSGAMYLYRLPNGMDAEVFIARSLLDIDTIDVATDRVRTQKIAGRNVIIIDTITEDGFWQSASAYFPEPFGTTQVLAMFLPRSEFMRIVQLVASSTRTQ